MNDVAERTGWERLLEELAASRGIGSIEELAGQVNEKTGKGYTARELRGWPRGGFGNDLDAVLHLTEEEAWRIADTVAKTFLAPRYPR